MNKELYLVVVCGGISTEREVSLRSGRAIYEALERHGFSNLQLFELKKDNLSELIALHPDLVYLALHGKGGEDGCVQGALELSGIPYTGPGVDTSAICMNKVFAKHMLSAIGIPTPRYLALRKDECADKPALCKKLLDTFGLPVVLKSPCQGSSIGVVIARKAEELPLAIDEVFRYGNELLAEEFIDGTETTLPIIGNDELTLLPEIEITSERDFYDFTAKYTQGLCHHIIPARISDKDRKKMREIGRMTYQKLGCRGVSRIDFIIDKVRGPLVIEINTCPGMTEMSLVPDAGRAAGIPFDELVAKIAAYGFEAE